MSLQPLSASVKTLVDGISPVNEDGDIYAPDTVIELPLGMFLVTDAKNGKVYGRYPLSAAPSGPSRTGEYRVDALDYYLSADAYQAGQMIRLLDGSTLDFIEVPDVDRFRIQRSGQHENEFWRRGDILEWIGGSSFEVITLPDPAPDEMPDAEIAAKLETGEHNSVVTKPEPADDDIDTNPFEATPETQLKHIMAELATAQQRIERQDAELRDYRRLVDDLMTDDSKPQPAARKVVSTLWQAVGNTRDTKTCDLLDAAIADKLNAGYRILNITVTYQADGKPTHRVVTFEADEVIAVTRIFDPFATTVTVQDNLTADELVGNKAVA